MMINRQILWFNFKIYFIYKKLSKVSAKCFIFSHFFRRFAVILLPEDRIGLCFGVARSNPIWIFVGLLRVTQDPLSRVDVVVLVLDGDLF